MYNRYVPQPDGSHKKQSSSDIPQIGDIHDNYLPPEMPLSIPIHSDKTESPDHKPVISSELTNGDLMTLLAMLLIASEGNENRTTALLTLVFYFLT